MSLDATSFTSNAKQLQSVLEYIGYANWTEAYDTSMHRVPSFPVFFREMWASISAAGGTWNCTPMGFEIVVVPLDNVFGWNNLAFFSATIFLATLLTIIRYHISPKLLCWAKRSGLRKSDAVKVPECVWRATTHSILWGFSLYIIVWSGRNTFFHEPCSVWDGVLWNPALYTEEQPFDLQLLYGIQLAHYLHGAYATLFLEAWRSDSIALIIHHVVTMSLLSFSFVYRFIRLGVLVLFLHDISDVLLELTKLSVYFQWQHGKFSKVNKRLSSVGFVLFTGSWILFRLYWYPLKVLHASTWCVFLSPGCVDRTLFYAFNSLLWALQGLHLYWFSFIVILLYKILTGKIAELQDIREQNDCEGDKILPIKDTLTNIRKEAKVCNRGTKTEQDWRYRCSNGDIVSQTKKRRRGSINP